MRKNRIVRIICALAAIFFVIILIPSGEVSAAASVITQTKYATDSVTVNWTKVRGATEYYLGIGESKEGQAGLLCMVACPPVQRSYRKHKHHNYINMEASFLGR